MALDLKSENKSERRTCLISFSEAETNLANLSAEFSFNIE